MICLTYSDLMCQSGCFHHSGFQLSMPLTTGGVGVRHYDPSARPSSFYDRAFDLIICLSFVCRTNFVSGITWKGMQGHEQTTGWKILTTIVQEYVSYVFQNPKTRLFTFFGSVMSLSKFSHLSTLKLLTDTFTVKQLHTCHVMHTTLY